VEHQLAPFTTDEPALQRGEQAGSSSLYDTQKTGRRIGAGWENGAGCGVVGGRGEYFPAVFGARTCGSCAVYGPHSQRSSAASSRDWPVRPGTAFRQCSCRGFTIARLQGAQAYGLGPLPPLSGRPPPPLCPHRGAVESSCGPPPGRATRGPSGKPSLARCPAAWTALRRPREWLAVLTTHSCRGNQAADSIQKYLQRWRERWIVKTRTTGQSTRLS
jgi:hypothetical protein